MALPWKLLTPLPPWLSEVEVVNADYNVDDNNNRHTHEGDGDAGDGDSENIEYEKTDNVSSKAAVCMKWVSEVMMMLITMTIIMVMTLRIVLKIKMIITILWVSSWGSLHVLGLRGVRQQLWADLCLEHKPCAGS